ncbi:MAG: hypothetical protein HRT53_07770 [Colwellia sp.]|nr:hypothetical protein [Colwellia sp.]
MTNLTQDEKKAREYKSTKLSNSTNHRRSKSRTIKETKPRLAPVVRVRQLLDSLSTLPNYFKRIASD